VQAQLDAGVHPLDQAAIDEKLPPVRDRNRRLRRGIRRAPETHDTKNNLPKPWNPSHDFIAPIEPFAKRTGYRCSSCTINFMLSCNRRR